MQFLGLSTTELENALSEMGEPKFRGRQLAAWLYRKGATDFDAMTDLPQALRERLKAQHSFDFPLVAARHQSRDGSAKLLLQMNDGEQIETVRLPFPDRLSVCVSSQAGCAMACQFCAKSESGDGANRRPPREAKPPA